ncbi:unnamed protein product, partial [Staurois parvus]
VKSLTTSRPAVAYKRLDGGTAGSGGRLLTAYPNPALPAVSSGHSETPIVGQDLCTRSRSCDH